MHQDLQEEKLLEKLLQNVLVLLLQNVWKHFYGQKSCKKKEGIEANYITTFKTLNLGVYLLFKKKLFWSLHFSTSTGFGSGIVFSRKLIYWFIVFFSFFVSFFKPFLLNNQAYFVVKITASARGFPNSAKGWEDEKCY